MKIMTIENLDSRAVGPIYEAVKDWEEPVAISVLPAHPTPCELRTHTAVILIGHINKEGSIAGPKVLEHILDTVLQFEGDQHYMYRIPASRTASEALPNWVFTKCGKMDYGR